MSVSSVTVINTIYSIRVDDATSTVTYIGEAPLNASESSSVWRIKRLETIGNILSITYADGDQNFDNVWIDRASLTYT